mgnify:FL=1
MLTPEELQLRRRQISSLDPYDSPRAPKMSIKKDRGFHAKPSGLNLKLKNSSLIHNSVTTRKSTIVSPKKYRRVGTVIHPEVLS